MVGAGAWLGIRPARVMITCGSVGESLIIVIPDAFLLTRRRVAVRRGVGVKVGGGIVCLLVLTLRAMPRG